MVLSTGASIRVEKSREILTWDCHQKIAIALEVACVYRQNARRAMLQTGLMIHILPVLTADIGLLSSAMMVPPPDARVVCVDVPQGENKGICFFV
jgi:hypothetical protein